MSDYPQVPIEVRDWVEKRVEHEYDRDRALIKDAIGGALKVLGWCVAFLAVGFAFLGVRTCFDLDRAIRAAADREVAKRLATDDPSSAFNRTVSKALFNSYVVAIARARSQEVTERDEIIVDRGDVDQLMAMAFSPKTSKDDFDNVVRVLLQDSSDGETTAIIRRRLTNLAAASESGARWIANDIEKRATLLDRASLAKATEFLPVVRMILADTSNDRDYPQLTAREALNKRENVSRSSIFAQSSGS